MLTHMLTTDSNTYAHASTSRCNYVIFFWHASTQTCARSPCGHAAASFSNSIHNKVDKAVVHYQHSSLTVHKSCIAHTWPHRLTHAACAETRLYGPLLHSCSPAVNKQDCNTRGGATQQGAQHITCCVHCCSTVPVRLDQQQASQEAV